MVRARKMKYYLKQEIKKIKVEKTKSIILKIKLSCII